MLPRSKPDGGFASMPWSVGREWPAACLLRAGSWYGGRYPRRAASAHLNNRAAAANAAAITAGGTTTLPRASARWKAVVVVLR